MKFSIVTPSFNSEKFIEATIGSIANQGYRDFEHIVIDGASKDGTVRILERYPHIRWESKPDKGQSDALNKGFAKATGEIFAWQNADDLYLPDAFATVAETFRAHPEVDVVYGGYQVIDADGKWVCDVHSRDWNLWLFQHGRFVPHQPTTFWRRRVHEKLAQLDEDLHYCMDVDFYCRATRHFRFLHVYKLLGQFRTHDESKTQNTSNQGKVHAEYRRVLARNFGYGPLDYLFFEGFYYRSRLANYVKRNWLKSL